MSSNIVETDRLTSAICNKADNRSLSEEEQRAYDDFEATVTVDDFLVRGLKLMEIESYDIIAKAHLSEFESRLTGATQTEAPMPNLKVPTKQRIIRYMAAASIITIFTIGTLMYYSSTTKNGSNALAEDNDIAAGGYRAMLVLSKNEQIPLEELKTGQTLHDGASEIQKKDSGTLVYLKNSTHPSVEAVNMLITRRKETYSVQLSDGTKVYLNAESKLTYPTEFSDTLREVEITGEGYFEVTPGKRPFIVKYNGQVIRVLGTKFNINTYKNEKKITTTLLEGAVQLITKSNTIKLKPSQQAIVTDNIIEVKDLPSAESAISWVKGNFSFDRLTLKEIMHQIERWYDVEVLYAEQPDTNPITIRKIPRNLPLSKMLEIIRAEDRFSYTIIKDASTVVIKK